jgi:hypothetical protein
VNTVPTTAVTIYSAKLEIIRAAIRIAIIFYYLPGTEKM